MGLGMARGATTVSSLPQADEDALAEEVVVDGEEEDQLSAEEEAAAEQEAVEAEARRQGWRPLAEYRGKPGGWKTAQQFIADGQNYLPFVKKELSETKAANARIATEMEGLRTEMAQGAKQMEKLLDFSRRANQAGYDRAVADLKAQQREAVTAGDVVTFDKIDGQLTEMAEARGEAEPEPQPEPLPRVRPAVALPQDYQDFMAENPWFNNDRVLNGAMIAEHNAVIEEFPGMALGEQLERAKEAVMARHPKKFGLEETPPAPPARRPAAPLPPRTPGPRQPGPRQGDDPIESIADPRERSDARTGYAAAKKSMPSLTKAEYMEVFTNPHGDVLDTIDRNRSRK